MSKRLANDFQFIDVGRGDPDKKGLQSRKREYVALYNPFTKSRLRNSRTAVWSAVTPIANGSARCTISFPTG